MNASENPPAEGRSTDMAEDRKVLREMKEKSDHLDDVVGEAREAVREAQKVQEVGTEQSGGQAGSGVVGGDAKEPDGGGEDDDASASTDDQSAAGSRESQETE